MIVYSNDFSINVVELNQWSRSQKGHCFQTDAIQFPNAPRASVTMYCGSSAWSSNGHWSPPTARRVV
jgi:hypothetical protein